MALPHLPLVQWGDRYPIGAVKVGHQHLQNVLNLQEVKKGKTRAGEKEKSGLERQESQGKEEDTGSGGPGHREERKGSEGINTGLGHFSK